MPFAGIFVYTIFLIYNNFTSEIPYFLQLYIYSFVLSITIDDFQQLLIALYYIYGSGRKMNETNAEYGKRIRNIREYQHLSREKLAEMSNISTQFLADIETGKKGMSVVTLHKICTALHTTADSIVFGSGSKSFPELEAMFATVPPEKREALQEIIRKIIAVL